MSRMRACLLDTTLALWVVLAKYFLAVLTGDSWLALAGKALPWFSRGAESFYRSSIFPNLLHQCSAREARFEYEELPDKINRLVQCLSQTHTVRLNDFFQSARFKKAARHTFATPVLARRCAWSLSRRLTTAPCLASLTRRAP